MKIAWLFVSMGIAMGAAAVFWPGSAKDPGLDQSAVALGVQNQGELAQAMRLSQADPAPLTTGSVTVSETAVSRTNLDETHQMLKVLNGSN